MSLSEFYFRSSFSRSPYTVEYTFIVQVYPSPNLYIGPNKRKGKKHAHKRTSHGGGASYVHWRACVYGDNERIVENRYALHTLGGVEYVSSAYGGEAGGEGKEIILFR